MLAILKCFNCEEEPWKHLVYVVTRELPRPNKGVLRMPTLRKLGTGLFVYRTYLWFWKCIHIVKNWVYWEIWIVSTDEKFRWIIFYRTSDVFLMNVTYNFKTRLYQTKNPELFINKHYSMVLLPVRGSHSFQTSKLLLRIRPLDGEFKKIKLAVYCLCHEFWSFSKLLFLYYKHKTRMRAFFNCLLLWFTKLSIPSRRQKTFWWPSRGRLSHS